MAHNEKSRFYHPMNLPSSFGPCIHSTSLSKYFFFSSIEDDKSFNREIVSDLQKMLDRCNLLVKTFRMAREVFHTNKGRGLRIRLIRRRSSDGRRYNLPTCLEVSTLIVGDIEINNTKSLRETSSFKKDPVYFNASVNIIHNICPYNILCCFPLDMMTIEKTLLLVMSIWTLHPNGRG